MPARFVVLIAGLTGVALAGVNLWHEFHAAIVDRNIALGRAASGVVWLVAIILGFLGLRLGVFVAGAIAFAEFALTASTHFESGASASLENFVKKEGVTMAPVDMVLLLACIMLVIGAAAAWTSPNGRNHQLATLPLFMASLVGAALVIAQASDDFRRTDFGSANPEDGAFAAVILAALWLVGGLWISSVRRTGALFIALATFGVWYSFVTLHVVSGTTVNQIASNSGLVWAISAAGAAIVAAASFLVVTGLLAWSFVRRKPPSAAAQPVRRGA